MPTWIDGLAYGSGCGFLLIVAIVVFLTLDHFIPWRDNPNVIGSRLNEKSAEQQHYAEHLRRMDETYTRTTEITPRNAELKTPISIKEGRG